MSLPNPDELERAFWEEEAVYCEHNCPGYGGDTLYPPGDLLWDTMQAGHLAMMETEQIISEVCEEVEENSKGYQTPKFCGPYFNWGKFPNPDTDDDEEVQF